MRLSDLQSKDVVSLKDGKKIGRIIDVEISMEGKIMYMMIEQRKMVRSFVMGGNDTTISFTQISKIGEDVILVDV